MPAHDGTGALTASGRPRPAWIIAALGIALAVAFVAYLNANRAYLDVPVWFLSVGIALVVILLVGLVFAAYWVTNQRFRTETEWHVVVWSLAGLVGTVALTFWPILYQRAVGNVVSDPTLILLISAGIGANAGALVGIYEARSRRQYDQIERARDTLLFLNRTLRHNILNAVNLIDGYASLLEARDDLPDDERLHAHIETIRTQTDAISDLISNARVLSRLGEESLRPVDLSALLDQQLDGLAKTYPRATIERDYQPGVTVLGDDLLSALVENLVSNGVVHNDTDQPNVEVSLDERPDAVELRVADNGPGIDDEVLETAFDPGDHGDHGLGLYIVETLAGRYGGEVAIDDGSGGGTVVTVTLQPA